MNSTPRGLDWAIAKCETLFERGVYAPRKDITTCGRNRNMCFGHYKI